MSQAFPVSGNIEPLGFPYLLVDLHRHGATGSLKVTGATHPKALYFRSGRILFGSSNDSRDQLGAILIDSGRLTREQLDDVNAKVGPGNPLAKVLSESGFVSQRELNEAARHKVERILADVLSWDRGTFEFEDGVLPKGSVDLKLSTERLLLAAVQRVGDRAFALRHVELGSVLEPVPGGDSMLSEIRADVWPVLERLDGRRTLKDAIALTRLDEFEAVKTACALLFLGVVRKLAAPEEQELDLAGEAQSAFGEAADAAFAESLPEPPAPTAPPAPAFALPAADDSPMYTVPLEPVRPAPTGFAFVEETAVPEPAADSELPVTFSMPAEPFPAIPLPEPPPPPAPEPTVRMPFAGEPLFQPDLEAPTRAAEEELEPFPEVTALPPAEPEPYSETEPFSEPLPAFGEPEPEAEPTIIDARLAATPYTTAPEPPTWAPPAYEPPPAPLSFAPAAEVEAEPETIDTEAETLVPPTAAYAPTFASRSYEPEPVPPPDPSAGAAGSRPSQEDLAALDALLSPAAPARPEKPPADERWEPQFRSTPQPTPLAPRRPPTRIAPAPAAPSRLPILVTALAAVVVTTVAAWYFFLRSPKPPMPVAERRPATVATARPAPPAAVPLPTAAAPVATPTTPAPTVAPGAVPSSPPASRPAPLPPAATPPPAVATRPAPVAPATATAPAGDGHALLAQGALPQAAHAFARSLAAGARDRYSVQLLTACSPENVQKAVSAGGSELFILPVSVKGQECYRVCWGLFDGRSGAEAALPGLPAYFRQSGVRPRLSSVAELVP